MDKNKCIIDLDGQKLIFETGKIGRQANGSVMLHVGETTLLSTACASKKPLEEVDFLPLRVDYMEKFSSVGKTLGGFIKREGRPATREILVSRFIDRSLRPLFEEGYYHDVQILSYVYSYDGIHTPDVLAICASAAALVISDIPLSKPLAAVRVGLVNDEFIINPDPETQKKSQLDLVLAGTENAILMIEGFCDFLTEEKVIEAIDFGHSAIRKICDGLKKWQEQIGKEKSKESLYKVPSDAMEAVENFSKEKLTNALQISNKKERELATGEIKEKMLEELLIEDEKETLFTKRDLEIAYKKFSSKVMRKRILEKDSRIDGRKLDEIRPISIETNFLPRTHGNALFTRGETQAIAVCTLGSETMAQRYEDLHGEGQERFYLQYFFPPFSVGEVGRSGPPGRREIGHGKLAEKSLEKVLPENKDFPYVIRLESNITESNGSSSMASVCGGCLALMHAGVPISKPISGIAMGLILEDENYKILSDILGAEDALGDMDFKVTGNYEGITGFQMDIKVEGITKEIMTKALLQAKEGRKHILDEMLKAYPKSSPTISQYAPKIDFMQINPSKIGLVIGPGGKQIKAIIEECNVEMNITDEGVISLSSSTSEGIEKARKMILEITGEVEKGKVYEGTIVSIKNFGLFVRIFSQEGLCHISEISHSRINDLTKIFKVGDKLKVKVIDINENGQIKLSHKVLLENN